MQAGRVGSIPSQRLLPAPMGCVTLVTKNGKLQIHVLTVPMHWRGQVYRGKTQGKVPGQLWKFPKNV
jgi:hypothetical protein